MNPPGSENSESPESANLLSALHDGVKSTEEDPRIGSVVDKYAVVQLLGRGGMGAVYEARHTQLSRRFAIKFLLPQFAANADVLRRFENEARAAGGLEHSNLAAVTDMGRAADGSPYLVMEYLEGEDCAKLLQRSRVLPVVRAANLVVQACRGLAVAHAAGIVHRDIKPENLFVARAGDGNDWVKVLDFGIAKLRQLDAESVTRTGAALGTALYMSPEQARGAANVDERTDVWSLGVVLYQLLSGRRPFEGRQFLHVVHQILSVEPPPLAQLCPELPPALLRIVSQAMHKDISQRVPSVAALAEALGPFAGNWAFAATHMAQVPLGLDQTSATPATSIGGVSLSDSALRGSEMYAAYGSAEVPSQAQLPIALNLATHPSSAGKPNGAKKRLGLMSASLAAAVVATVGWHIVNLPQTSIPSTVAGLAPSFAEPSSVANAAPQLVRGSAAESHIPATAPIESAAPSASVRSVSEHFEHGSNKRGASPRNLENPPATKPPALETAAEVPPPPLVPAENNAIQIEQNNPYDP